jgi:hypothetical protein
MWLLRPVWLLFGVLGSPARACMRVCPASPAFASVWSCTTACMPTHAQRASCCGAACIPPAHHAILLPRCSLHCSPGSAMHDSNRACKQNSSISRLIVWAATSPDRICPTARDRHVADVAWPLLSMLVGKGLHALCACTHAHQRSHAMLLYCHLLHLLAGAAHVVCLELST